MVLTDGFEGSMLNEGERVKISTRKVQFVVIYIMVSNETCLRENASFTATH